MAEMGSIFAPHKKGDEPINEPLNVVLKVLLELIKNTLGIKKTAILTCIAKSRATLTRYIKQLLEQNLIEYRGSKKCYNFPGLFLRFTARRIITYYRFYDVSVVVVVYFKGNASLLMTYLFHHVVEGIVGYVIVMSFYLVNGFIPLGCR